MLAKEHLAYPKLKSIPELSLLKDVPQLLANPHKFFIQAFERYGDIYTLPLGLTKVIVINQPRYAQHIFQDNWPNYRKRGSMWAFIRTVFGNGLVVSEGDYWRRQRRMMQPHFHRHHVTRLIEMMLEAIDAELDRWPTQALAFDIAQAMAHMTMGVIIKTMFGMGLKPEEKEQAAVAMTHVLDYFLTGMVTQTLPNWLPLPGQKQYASARKQFDTIVSRMIEQGRRGEIDPDSLLAMLLNTTDADTGQSMTDAQVRDEVTTIFMAGYETTALALAWTYHYLTQQPIAAAKLQAEVDTALNLRPPAASDLPKLQYTRLVFQEAMRIRPAIWFQLRMAMEDDVIDGYRIPARANIMPLTFLYHRHPEHWERPEQFEPERFSAERSATRHRFAWLPFGAGQRMCIGKEMAMALGPLVLARVAQRFRLAAHPDRVARPHLSSTLRPKDGVWVQLWQPESSLLASRRG